MKKSVYVLIGVAIILGAIVPFAAQFLFPFFFDSQTVVGAEIWNQYVSIILGVVATITSIVSLTLGFRSEEESKATELRTRDTLYHIEKEIEKLSLKQDQLLQSSLTRNYNESEKGVSVDLNRGKKPPLDDEQVN